MLLEYQNFGKDDETLTAFSEIIRKNVEMTPFGAKEKTYAKRYEIDDMPFPFDYLHDLVSKKRNFAEIESLIRYFPSNFREIKKEFEKIKKKINDGIITLNDFCEKIKTAIEIGMMDREKKQAKRRRAK